MKAFTRQQLAPITKHLAQCQVFAQKEAIVRLYQVTRSLSRDALANFLSDLIELYESPLFLKIYPDRENSDGVWDKTMLETLLAFREKTNRERKAQQQALFFQESRALTCKSAITSDIATRLGDQNFTDSEHQLASLCIPTPPQAHRQIKSASKAKDSFDVPDPKPQRSYINTPQKSEARKILEKQIVFLDAFKDFPLLQQVQDGSTRAIKFRAHPKRQFISIMSAVNATEKDRLFYYRTRLAYLESKVLSLLNKKGKPKYSTVAYKSILDWPKEEGAPKFLASVSGARAHIKSPLVVLGLLVKMETGYGVEDGRGQLSIDISKARIKGDAIFNQGSIVLLSGVVEDDGKKSTLRVSKIAQPPILPSTKQEDMGVSKSRLLVSAKITESSEWFGAEQAVARQLEEYGTLAFTKSYRPPEHVANSVYILSQLNKQSIRDLNDIFEKMDKEGVPSLIVLIGEFNGAAACQMVQSLVTTKHFFDSLADILADKKELRQHTQWVIVPGPDDFLPFSAFPNPHLSRKLLGRFRKTVTNLELMSNPCRISYFGKELVICRGDFSKLFITNDIFNSKEFKASAMINTLLGQGCLLPFLKKSQLILWNYGHALHLHSVPDVLVIADSYYHFENCLEGGQFVVSPGSFGLHKTFAGLYFNPEGKLEAQLIDFKTPNEEEKSQLSQNLEQSQNNREDGLNA